MRLLLIGALLFIAAGCKIGSNTAQKNTEEYVSSKVVLHMTAPIVVYKTRSDYNNLVSVTLSKDKQGIASYPDPSDLSEDNNYGKPIELEDGYLLDQRGVNEFTAFVQITYEEYALLKVAPSTEELKKKLVDKDPLTELYQCGFHSQYSNVVQELNHRIKKNELEEICKKKK